MNLALITKNWSSSGSKTSKSRRKKQILLVVKILQQRLKIRKSPDNNNSNKNNNYQRNSSTTKIRTLRALLKVIFKIFKVSNRPNSNYKKLDYKETRIQVKW